MEDSLRVVKNTPLTPYLFIGGVFRSKFCTHYREPYIIPENQLRNGSDPLIWPKNGIFHLPPLMFWACPVETSTSEGQLQRVRVQPVYEAVRWRQQLRLQSENVQRGSKNDRFEGFP